jgi:6-phosphogluconolactonase
MIKVFADYEELSRGAADLIAAEALAAVHDHGRFSIALAGGNTPRRTYEILSTPPLRDRVPWMDAHIFWGDERCVPPRDPRNNTLMARRALLDHVPVPASQVHPIVCVRTPAEAAKQYEVLIRTFFAGHETGFDLIFLGLGEDGHTASLFPGSPVLEERSRCVADVYVQSHDLYRVTLTPQLINRAKMVVFLVSGTAKASILREVLEGDESSSPLPARLIKPINGKLIWLADREAASLLGKTSKR